MSKTNALAGLIGNYGDSDEEAEEAVSSSSRSYAAVSSTTTTTSNATAAIHPAPIPHCPWSACYDESSGFTYYWNHVTNAVTWDAPPEYLLALKLAQQQLNTAGSTEVSAEEWQLYQQALAEKQNSQNKSKVQTAVTTGKLVKKNEKPAADKSKEKVAKYARSKRPHSDDEEEKIELITSYYNSDSESNEETEGPAPRAPPPAHRAPAPALPPHRPDHTKHPAKKQKIKPAPVEYGPSLPPNQDYTVPIGPELPPSVAAGEDVLETVEQKVQETSSKKVDIDEDESALLSRLKDKAKLLEKLGGEIPKELQNIIKEDTGSGTASPKVNEENIKESKSDVTNIDDLLDEIEKKELPKIKAKIDMFGDEEPVKSSNNSARNSPKSGTRTPVEEFKPLFPSGKAIIEEEKTTLFPSAVNIVQETETDAKVKEPVPEKKSSNLYLPDANELVAINRKKLRISNSVLPERKVNETPSYTTKYSQQIEGFTSERKGLGFSQDEKEDVDASSPKKTVNYGNGLMFTKGEVLNEDKRDEGLDDNLELVDAKLKYLNQLQPCAVTPVQEMLIQMQTLSAALRCGALSAGHMRRWARAALGALSAHEARAAPPGWCCRFLRSERRYQYVREADGHTQYEYPVEAVVDGALGAPSAAGAAGHCDMDICTTPPHPGIEDKDPPPLPPPPPPPPRVVTPPPPAWSDPPPPGVHDLPPLPPEPPKQEDELQSFYKDIAELEKQTVQPPLPPGAPPLLPGGPIISGGPTVVGGHAHSAGNSPEHTSADARDDKHKEKDSKVSKKKSKVKISSSVGLKHKSVSNLVAKWQQLAEEIHSD